MGSLSAGLCSGKVGKFTFNIFRVHVLRESQILVSGGFHLLQKHGGSPDGDLVLACSFSVI
jgi:hypothetical protein